MLPFRRELVLQINFISFEYIDYIGGPCLQNARWSTSEGHRLWAAILHCASRPVGRPKLRYKYPLKRDLKALIRKTGNNWHWSVLPGALSYKTDERIQTYIAVCNPCLIDR